MISEGSKRSLIVKNVTTADFCKYSVSCKGEKLDAELCIMKPFTKNMSDTEGYIGGIAVFECEVQPGTQVTWFYGSQMINRQNFRSACGRAFSGLYFNNFIKCLVKSPIL